MHGTVPNRRPAWFPDWSGDVAAILASGESATPEAVELLRGRCRLIVVNTSYHLAPWADVLYACDAKWWGWHDGAADFAGLKVTYEKIAADKHNLQRVDLLPQGEGQDRLCLVPGQLGRGENSGFQAFNLALQFGARRLLLLGLDYCGKRWHGEHPNKREQSPHTLERWRAIFDTTASEAKAMGADVVNLSAVSALKAFPKLTIEQAFERWRTT